ncbi:Flagellar biosynthesis protein FlhB [hydrothermal vent metagenome]|uniref:Flagellar biosynthetic protein FlhB n=1 Tax=hydrothermal vent metagenome TaxID=652676 RepID=A0A3B0SKF1_9ZZZZ
MADDQDESQKTEEPTQKKLQEAHEKGEVAKSQEVRHWFILFSVTVIILVSAKSTMAGIREILGGVLGSSHGISIDAGNILGFMSEVFGGIFAYVTLPIIILMVGALLGAVIQHRPLLTAEKIKPKLNKISPLAGFKRLFSLQNFFEITKSVLKITIVGSVVFWLVWPERHRLEQMVALSPGEVADVIFIMVLRIFGGVVAVMAVIAGLDYMFQKFQFIKKMRMTKQEIKDEMKQTDGDPHVKARLRQIRLERARGRMMAAVPDADVVVTNPTHFAVALKYEHQKMEVPMVVAKGVDHIALKIREVAKENNIPILENPPLARALYATVEVDEEINEDHYKAVAEVVGYIMRLKKGEAASYKPSE